jgi:hypothetical protein
MNEADRQLFASFFWARFLHASGVFCHPAEMRPRDSMGSFDSICRRPLNGVLISWVFVPLIFPSPEQRNFKTDAAGWD